MKNFKFLQISLRRFSKDVTPIHFETATIKATPHTAATTTTATTVNASTSSSGSSGSTFIERLSACLVGIAIGYSVNFYMLYEVSCHITF